MGWGFRRLRVLLRVRGRGVSSGLSPLPAGLTAQDVDIFEINEAFASQVSLFPNTT